MVQREEAKYTWRQELPPKCLEDDFIGLGIGIFINSNKARLLRERGGSRDKTFAEEKALADRLISEIDGTLMCARISLENIPYSTMMLEKPGEAISELARWICIYAEAIEVRSHLRTRLDAASNGLYWHAPI